MWLNNAATPSLRQLIAVFDHLPLGVTLYDQGGCYVWQNALATDYHGPPVNLSDRYPAPWLPTLYTTLAQGETFRTEWEQVMEGRSAIAHLSAEQGRRPSHWYQVIARAIADGEASLIVVQEQQISESKYREKLLAGQNQILEATATDVPLVEILTRLIQIIEVQAYPLMGSILLCDGTGHILAESIAPSLPTPYCHALKGLAIGPQAGSCGTAAYRREPVIVADLATDPLWENYAELATHYGLRAAWSNPIFASDGRVVGTLCFYDRVPRQPTSAEWQLLQESTHLAGIAIERQQSRQALRNNENRYREQSQMLAHFSRSLKELHRLSTGVYRTFAECSEVYLTAGRELLDLPIGMILQRHGPRYSINHIQSHPIELLAGTQLDGVKEEIDHLSHQTWIGNTCEQCCQHPLAAHLPVQTAITTPILVDQEVYGILSFVSLTAREMPFADYECEILELMARDLGRFMAAHRGELHRQSVESALRYSEMKYRSIFENITQGIFQTTLDGRYLNANPFLAELYGYDSPVDLIMNLTDVAHQLYVDPQRRGELAAQTQAAGIVYHAESQVYRRDRTIIWVSETQRAVRDQQGNLLYFEGTVEDITARRHAEEQLQYNAYHDPLTGLHNRTWFTEQLQSRIDQSLEEEEASGYAVLFIDLDRFKIINDGLGHIVGDRLLQEVAQRLQETLPPSAKLARFGGDEFAVLLPDVGDTAAAEAIAAHLVTQMQEPIFLEQRSFSVGASVGIVLGDRCANGDRAKNANRTYQRPDQLLRDADLAMYRAKAEGGSTSALFEPSMLPVALARLELEHDLKRALELAELHLYYQPIFNLKTGELHSLEALVRWHHNQRGWISPTDFIPVAEETGQIHVIGWWVLEQACQQLRQWRASYPNLVNLSVHVNVSVLQLKETDLVARIMALLQRLKLPPQALKLEMTETSFLETANFDSLIFQEIQQLGIGFCIDDFGTGYSSLSRLHNLPINTIKVDRTFVIGVDQDPTKMAIAQTIIDLAHNLGANVVSEGIESEAQHQKLQQLGCELGQGYWLSRPMDVPTAQRLLNQSSHRQWIQGRADNLNHHNPELQIWA